MQALALLLQVLPGRGARSHARLLAGQATKHLSALSALIPCRLAMTVARSGRHGRLPRSGESLPLPQPARVCQRWRRRGADRCVLGDPRRRDPDLPGERPARHQRQVPVGEHASGGSRSRCRSRPSRAATTPLRKPSGSSVSGAPLAAAVAPRACGSGLELRRTATHHGKHTHARDWRLVSAWGPIALPALAALCVRPSPRHARSAPSLPSLSWPTLHSRRQERLPGSSAHGHLQQPASVHVPAHPCGPG